MSMAVNKTNNFDHKTPKMILKSINYIFKFKIKLK